MKNKTFSFINIAGLTIGITSFLLIALYIFDELTFDSFHKKADNIYRVVENKISAEGKKAKTTGAGYQVSEKAKADLPEIKDAVRLSIFGRANVAAIENNNVFYEDFILGSQSFLAVFDFPLLQGNRKTALTSPHSVIITEETAKKFFGTTNAEGKTLKVDRDSSVSFKVTGVLKNFPVNSSISFNLLFPNQALPMMSLKNLSVLTGVPAPFLLTFY